MSDPLEDELNQEFAPAWRPDAGDTIIGRVVDLQLRTGDWEPYWIVTLELDDGERQAVHAFHFVLAEELRKIRPQIGHRIAIKYLGKPDGKRYENYRVATENKPEVDWGASPDPGASPDGAATDRPVEPDIPSATDALAASMPAAVASGPADDDIPF